MDEFFKKIRSELNSIKLTERERLDTRLYLHAFMDEHPATAPHKIRFGGRFADAYHTRTYHIFRFGSMALAFLLTVSIGTSYAAQTALPGEPLYSLKVAVDEPIERATVASSQSQTQWDVTLANRRLEEAEKLAATGSLNPSNAAIIQTQLTADTQDFSQQVATLAASSSDAVQIADAQSDLEASLSVHAQALLALASSTPASQSAIAPILAQVREHAANAHAARIAALANIDSSDSTSTIQVAVTGEERDAVSGLESIRAFASKTAPTDATSTIDTDASSTEQSIRVGDSNLAAGHFRAAMSAFQNAIQTAAEAQVGAQIETAVGLNVNLPPVDSDNATSTQATTTPVLVATSTTLVPVATSTATDTSIETNINTK